MIVARRNVARLVQTASTETICRPSITALRRNYVQRKDEDRAPCREPNPSQALNFSVNVLVVLSQRDCLRKGNQDQVR